MACGRSNVPWALPPQQPLQVTVGKRPLLCVRSYASAVNGLTRLPGNTAPPHADETAMPFVNDPEGGPGAEKHYATAVELDVDRTLDDREFFAVERQALKPLFDVLFEADRASTTHTLLVAQASGPLGLNALGWAVLGFAIVFPILAFGVAFAVGYRRSLGSFALVMLVGLAVVAVLWVNVLAYAYTYGAQLLG